MKIIDTKGRIFGLINLVDLLIIILAVALILSLRLNFSGLRKKTKADAVVSVVFSRIPNEVVRNEKFLKQNDVVLGGQAVIKKIADVKPTKDNLGRESGFSDIVVILQTHCVILNGEYYCGNIPMKINGSINFFSRLYTISGGTILDIDITSEER